MRIRRRYASLALASAAFLAVGALAYISTAGAALVCPPSGGNTSCLDASITPSKLNATTFKPITLFVHTHTDYAHPGDKLHGGFAKTVTILFDDDGKINLTGIPRCAPSAVAGKDIAGAWSTCGPGGGASKNAYLSPPTAVSGSASTVPPANLHGCTLVFNGPLVNGNPTTTLYSRFPTPVSGGCASPATNHNGQTTVVLQGTITNAGVPDFGKKLTVPNIDQAPLALDDFTSTVRRGSVFSARCHDANKTLNIRGIFQYTGNGETDTVNKTQPCTVG